MLISGVQLCLAHYCDVHGPTPLMVTEGLPVACSTCYEDDTVDFPATSDRLQSGAQWSQQISAPAATAITDALQQINPTAAHRSSSTPASERDAQGHRASLVRSISHTVTPPASAVESPPVSPHPAPNRDSGFRRTYDTRRANPCDNCAMTLPRRQEGASEDARIGPGGPTLRTRAPYARVYDSGATSPRSSQTTSSSSSDTEEAGGGRAPQRQTPTYGHRRTGTLTSTTSRSSASSSTARRSHTHFVNYTSTHEPGEVSFKMVRNSCLRTLSFEMLPRNPAASGTMGYQGMAPSTGVPAPPPSFVTTHSTGAAASGGPMFFGDPAAGYTTAYIFRIPDVHARGHKRVYALLALSTHRERQAMKPFGFIAAAFRDLAAWIQGMAEAEAERAADGSGNSSPVVVNPNYGAMPPPNIPTFDRATTAVAPGTSSFFAAAGNGISRRMGSGFAGSVSAPKARGLPEVVGQPDFFLELHTRFVRLLLELSVVLNS
ncbi:hypothetical protein GGTG_13771 [Gaeumannomyces tritici R3-111a-1]|uniref:UDENN FLCN/SMCR8-type domain-containing protein n=1 Tax=Gaeumannomyces tritici (strain R3-111a-1) TaxID=644352 RepID=J3PJT2_GAET3|nr:hypothetical protein GGTG_13771 [Gaeumannomyces tritici R3-111a-1]EJT68655.1 hypothetical protein GGTG_13771 [Gaeumannomyces tritici R3-111a-1]